MQGRSIAGSQLVSENIRETISEVIAQMRRVRGRL